MIRFISNLIKSEKHFERFAYIALDIILLGLVIIGFQIIDGEKIRPVIEFTNGVDSSEFNLEKEVYKRGEVVKIYTSFCKLRDAVGFTEWSLVNDQYVQLVKTAPKQLPVGCYPYNQDKYILTEVAKIPEEATSGEHYIVGANTQQFKTIFGKTKERVEYYKTEKFIIE